jgi:hypothetical protein
MGKASGRKRARSSSGIHEQITLEAEAARATGGTGFNRAGDFPALQALVSAARKDVERALPESIIFEGKRYWCRVSVGVAWLEVYPTAAAELPLGSAAFGDRAFLPPGH